MREEIMCARVECSIMFIPRAHNACYCGPQCRTIVMNARILAKYHENRRLKKSTDKRICITKGCVNILSKYNTEKYCESCKITNFEYRLKSWGWTDEDIENERAQWL